MGPVLQMRDVLDLFWDATIGAAQEAAEKYATDIEGLPEVRICTLWLMRAPVHACRTGPDAWRITAARLPCACLRHGGKRAAGGELCKRRP